MDHRWTAQLLLYSAIWVLIAGCEDDTPAEDGDSITDSELSPCAEGYRQDPDLPDEFLDDFPDGCVPQSCGIGRWGNLEVDGETVYVDANAAEGGDGSEDAPFTSIQAGLDAAGEAGGGMVAVAAGTYFENLLLTQDHSGVRLDGRCQELVVVDASGGEEDEPGIRADGYWGDEEWWVSGIAVTGAPYAGIWLEVGQLNITKTLVTRNRRSGVFARAGFSRLSLSGVVITDTQPGADGTNGRGINIQERAFLDAEDCLVEGNADVGIFAGGDDTAVHLSHVEVWDTKPSGDGGVGNGIAASQGAFLQAEGCRVEGNAGVGILVGHEGTTAQLSNVEVWDTQPTADGSFGWGIGVQLGAWLQAEDSRIEGNTGVGIYAAGEDTAVDLSNVEVWDTQPTANGAHGVGIEIGQSAFLQAEGCRVEGNVGVGIAVGHEGTTAQLSNVEVRDTQPLPDGTFGRGIAVQEGGALQAEDCLVEGNAEMGIWAGGEGTAVHLSHVKVSETQPLPDGTLGRGISIQDGASLHAEDCRIEDNAEAGIVVQEGAFLLAENCQVEGNTDFGVLATSEGSTVFLSNVEVEKTQPKADGTGGSGILVTNGASLLAEECLVEGNAEAGIAAVHEGTTVYLSNVDVRDTQPRPDGTYGRGITVQEGASLLAEGCRIEDCMRVGIFASGEDTAVHLSNVVVQDTKPAGDSFSGHGIEVVEGASLLAEDCLVVGNVGFGVGGDGEGTTVRLSNVVVRDTYRDGEMTVAVGLVCQQYALLTASDVIVSQTEGPGLVAMSAGTLSCTGCDLTDNAFAGAMVWGQGNLYLSETAVSATRPDANEGGGVGVFSATRVGPNTLLLENTAIEDQPYAAVWLDGDGSFTLRNSTLVGGYGRELEYPDGTTTLQHGDAIVVTGGVAAWDGTQGLLLEGNEILDAVRAGVLLAASSATLTNNSFNGNTTDLIWQDCDGVDEPSGLNSVPVVDYCPLYNHHIVPLVFNLWPEDSVPLE